MNDYQALNCSPKCAGWLIERPPESLQQHSEHPLALMIKKMDIRVSLAATDIAGTANWINVKR